MSDDETNPPCTEFSTPGARPPINPTTQKRHGEYGFFTFCQNGNCLGPEYSQQGCGTGYAQIGLCGGNGDVGNARTGCGNACPGLGVESCNRTCDSQRRICRRLKRDYTTEVNKNTHDLCCTLPIASAKDADCPPGYYLNSDACIKKNEEALMFRCLYQDQHNVLGVGCQRLALASNLQIRDDYIEELLAVCPYQIKHPACISVMQEFPDDTSTLRDYLEYFCKDKENVPEYRDVCACFYREGFYDDILKQIEELYVIPRQFLGSARKCYYPPCAGSPIQHGDPNYTCPAINLVNCIQSLTVNASGQIDRIVINQDIQGCGGIRPRGQPCPTECKSPEECVDGTCQDLSKCTQNAECGKDKNDNPRRCNNGVCEDVPKTSIWVYIGYFVLGVSVLVGFVLLMKMFKGKGDQKLTTPPSTASSA